MEKSNILVFIKSGLVALILSIFTYPLFAQVNTEQLSTTVIDTVDDEDDLFDDNTNYKELYKDLNKDGDWVQIKESDLDDDSDDPENVSTEVTNIRIINVWRPRGMGVDWSPYSEGRWVYTYSGWVWATDYDWGWAAYHYGRWIFYDLYGWLWMPGRYWAPSWVQWCYNPDYIGWYPIYPRRHGWHHGHHGWHNRYYHGGHHHNWVIVKRNHFTEKINKNVVVDRNKNAEILNGSKTKAIVKYNGSSLENVGPKITTIEKNTGQKIQPKVINYTGSKGIIKVDENKVNIYRNDVSKKEKINTGTKNREVNTGSKNKEVNTGNKNKESTRNKESNNNKESTRNKESNSNKESTRNKESNSNKESTRNKESNSNKESTRNKESNSNKGSTPNKESTRYREGNSNRESSRGNNGNSNRSNNDNSNRGNNGNSSRGNESSRNK